jgi:hypothetical protein
MTKYKLKNVTVYTVNSFKTGAGTHPAFYPMGTEDSFLGAKAAESVKLTTHLHLVPKLRMAELYSSIRLHGVELK